MRPSRTARRSEGPLRLVFLGTPDPAVVALRALVAAGHDVALVVSRADTRRGRRGEPEPSPVKAAARELGLEVSDRAADVVATGAQLGVVVAYGRIIRPEVLAEVPMVNVHFSLLPRWRGAAPVERAIMAGDTETGVCLMALEEGLDTGPVYRRLVVPIGPDDTAAGLRATLAQVGADLLVDALHEGLGDPEPQAGEVTYAAKLDRSELELAWTRPAGDLHRLVRVGRAWTTWRGRRLLVLEATPVDVPQGASAGPGSIAGDVALTGDGGLRLVTVQPEGRRPVSGAEWARGARPAPGELLGAGGEAG
ncbi:methionyl-tRNA formyltransferase [Acidiferrimicrobium sp. IK]|uniref:methionyl-tRNA formyltransferase n=1 Tax=Acidiferrimicrobium sp. IK TaxID=2871700 RepID=UPI00396778C7